MSKYYKNKIDILSKKNKDAFLYTLFIILICITCLFLKDANLSKTISDNGIISVLKLHKETYFMIASIIFYALVTINNNYQKNKILEKFKDKVL